MAFTGKAVVVILAGLSIYSYAVMVGPRPDFALDPAAFGRFCP